MKTSLQKRPVRLTGLVVLSLLVMATSVQAAQASAQPFDQLQLPTMAQVAQHHGVTQASAQPFDQLQLPTMAQVAQHHGVALRRSAVGSAWLWDSHAQASWGLAAASTQTAQAVTSGTSATTVWIVAAAVVAGALLVGAWLLVRRRRRGELASFCAQHPEDPRCATA